jgi:hypothetical protein
MAICLTIATPIIAWVSHSSWQRWAPFFGGLAIVVGYIGWRGSAHGHGVVAKQKYKWTTRIAQGCVVIEANYFRTMIPIQHIMAAQLVSDEDWGRSTLQEYFCLVMKLRGCPLISVPGSSSGFHEMLEALRQTIPVEILEM